VGGDGRIGLSAFLGYFGTKEGLLVADEFDTMSAEAVAGVLDPAEVGGRLRAVLRYEGSTDRPSRS
jgi:hypothetical protein